MCISPRRDRVALVAAHCRIQHDRQIGDAARQRPGHILRIGKRDHARPARQPARGAQAKQILIGRRNADRTAGIAAHTSRGEAGGNRRTGPATGTARRTQQIIGIARLAGERGDGGGAGGQLVHRRLAQDDGAGAAQLFQLVGILRRLQRRQRQRTARGWHVLGIEIVFHQHRNAVQRPAWAFAGTLLVQRIRLRQRGGIERDDTVQRRALAVIGSDAGQIGLHQLPRCHRSTGQSRLQLRDGGFRHLDVARRLRRSLHSWCHCCHHQGHTAAALHA